jgi:phosphoglycerate kinase
MKTVNDFNFKGKKVLLRCDFNVPLDKTTLEITDDTRIRESLPTIKKLLEDGAAVILMSHLGKPSETGYEAKFSLAPVAKRLSEKLSLNVQLASDIFGEGTKKDAANLKAGEVLLLENLRFLKAEQKPDTDPEFAKYLASLGDVYVNDAFGTAHRAHTSTAIIADYFPHNKYFGLLLAREVNNLEKLLNSAEKPFTAILGGSKVSSKIEIIENLLPRVNTILIGGGMAYTFFKALGGKIGNSLCEDDKLELAKEILAKANDLGVRIFLPVDTLAGDKFDNDANSRTVPTNDIPDGWKGMDIGTEAIELFKEKILESKTILWNGPMGVFEFDNFGKGTSEIALAVAEATQKTAFSAVGGGDSIAAINKNKLVDQISYISTGGGAMLEYLEGKTLPGVAALLK